MTGFDEKVTFWKKAKIMSAPNYPYGYGLPFRTRLRLYFCHKFDVKKWTNALLIFGTVPSFIYFGIRINVWNTVEISTIDIIAFIVPFFIMGVIGLLWLVTGKMYQPLYGYINGIWARINGFIFFLMGFFAAFVTLYFAVFNK